MPSAADLPVAGPSRPRPTQARPALTSLSRQSSLHAQTSLRRIATHETGAGIERRGKDGAFGREDDHHEHEDEDEGSATGSRGLIPMKSDEEVDSSDTHDKEVEGGRTPSDVEGQSAVEGGEGKKKRKQLEVSDQTNLLPVKQVITVFVGLSMALFCSLLDQTIVVTALPTIGQAFGRADIQAWIGTAYLLTSTAMQPLYGRLSDIFGRKPTLLAACIIFFLGSLACSVSASMIQLICFRAIQGVGGGGILTLSMIIVSDIVTLKERGKYQGVIGMVIATANSIGPLIGGLLTEKATWRWSFWISLPLTGVAFVVIVFLLPLKSVRGDTLTKLRAIDWIGCALTLTWAVLVLIGLSWAGTQYAWSSPAVLVPIILGLALLGLFLYVETRVRLPVIPLYIFRIPTVSAAMTVTFFSGVAFYCTLYYLPTYLQIVHGASPIHSGVLTLPLAAVQTTTAFIAGYITSKTGDYWYNLVIGFAIWTVGLGLLSTLSVDTPSGHFVGYQIIVGVGAGQTFQTSLLAIQAAVERKDMATATGTRNFTRMLGGTVGLAAVGAIVNNVVRTRLGQSGASEGTIALVLRDPTSRGGWESQVDLQVVREAYAKGISSIFYLMIPMTAISVLLTLFFIKKISLKRDDDAAKKEEGKKWIEGRAEKRRRRKGGAGAASGEGIIEEKQKEVGEGGGKTGSKLGRAEKGLEEAAEGVDEAAMGVVPDAPPDDAKGGRGRE